MYIVDKELRFPPPELANEEGLVAVGGDASPERLVLAYSVGIFPWPSPGYPLLWFSPDPRFVLDPRSVHVSRSLRKEIRKGEVEVRFDTAFAQVIDACANSPRPDQEGTWITRRLRDGYVGLHKEGLAHSVETYHNEKLVGGLYGVSLGRMFFGESMFSTRDNASKVAFCVLVAHCLRWQFTHIDCQVPTDHLQRFGAQAVPRATFLQDLHHSLSYPHRLGPWRAEMDGRSSVELIDLHSIQS